MNPQPSFFNSTSIDAVMQSLVVAFEQQMFSADGAPARPTVDLGDGIKREDTSSGNPLASKSFQVPPMHIPNAGDGANHRHSYKSELVLVRDPNIGTKKILWWYADDPRSTPHNHPWNFRSGIIAGGYTEERFWLSNGVLKKEKRKYEAGSINEVPADVFHNVVDVLPGTVTYLDCGPAREGNAWGYLDTDTSEYLPFKNLTPANFLECLQGINPHLIKK